MSDQEFVEYVVKALVDHPDEVSVKRSVDDMGVLIELTVNGEDMGKVIGKDGRTAKSIRTLLRVLGAKNDERVNMKIVEPDKGGEAVSEAASEAPAEPVEAAELAPEPEPESAPEPEPAAEPVVSSEETIDSAPIPEAQEAPEEESAKKRDHLAGLEDSPLDSFEV
jgi:uncharacterized protein